MGLEDWQKIDDPLTPRETVLAILIAIAIVLFVVGACVWVVTR